MMAGVGYFGLWLVGDPFAMVNIGATVPLVAFAIIPLAIGDMTIVVSANVLVGQEAPVLSRGTILGVFGMIGAIGIAVATFVGGEIFDAIGKTAPFVMMALLNFTVVVWAGYVYLSGQKTTVTAS
jgi:DHA1 family tetracycline resistance protein-like MFS transporter